MNNRTHMCGEVTAEVAGQSVILKGWVQRARNLGGIVFVWLRDRTGIVQVVFDGNDISKELLELAAEQSGISRDVIENYDEMPTNSLLYSLSMGNYGMGGGGPFTMPINHQIFLAQFDAIQKLSADGACVIVGRCADYALSKYPHLVSVFVHAEMKKRVERVCRLYNLSDKEAAERIIKVDKKRASYHNFYSTKKWGNADSYHLSVDSGAIGIDGTVDLIRLFADKKEA